MGNDGGGRWPAVLAAWVEVGTESMPTCGSATVRRGRLGSALPSGATTDTRPRPGGLQYRTVWYCNSL